MFKFHEKNIGFLVLPFVLDVTQSNMNWPF